MKSFSKQIGRVLAQECVKLVEDMKPFRELSEDEKSSFPHVVKHKREEYYQSGKFGHDRKTNEPAAEYYHMHPETGVASGKRVWRTKSGKITQD